MSHLLWLDLETTGLDPREHEIIEVAASVAPFHDPFNATPIYHAVLRRFPRYDLDPAVIQMHLDNNLWVEAMQAHCIDLEADEKLASALRSIQVQQQLQDRFTLAGFSVHFDLGFIKMYFPHTAKLLSHRIYDVSAIKLFCQSNGMSSELTQKSAVHRAKADVEEAIEHARKCAEWARNGFDGK